jgi:hypothetical protein
MIKRLVLGRFFLARAWNWSVGSSITFSEHYARACVRERGAGHGANARSEIKPAAFEQ